MRDLEKNRAYNRAWRAKNREKIRAKDKAWYAANLERTRARKRELYAASPEQRGKRCADQKRCRRANPERVKAANARQRMKSVKFAQKLTEFVMPLLPIEAQFEVMKMWTEHAGANNARSTD
jgi:hypothetical protein